MPESDSSEPRPADAYADRFSGIGRLFGRVALERFRRSHVAVIGVGGVGSWSAEALARSGLGTITLVDLDDVCVTNVNRQLHALDGNIGRSKVAATAERLRRIHPGGDVREVEAFLTGANVARLIPGDDPPIDVVIDAIDNVEHKCVLIDHCRRVGVEVIVAGGAGGKGDPASVRCGDLAHASHDRLLKQVRRTLRRDFGFPDDTASGRPAPFGIEAVYSIEDPVFPWSDGRVCGTAEPGGEREGAGQSLRLNCDSGFGTASFVTGAFGFAAAAAALRAVARREV